MEKALSPLPFLPPEILSDIFQGCVPTANHESIDLNRPPWSLAKVCRRWRSICLSMPSLWVGIPTVYVDDPSELKLSDPKFSDPMQTMLARSFPQDIHLCIERRNHSCSTITLMATINILASLPRVHSLDAEVDPMLYYILVHKGHTFRHLQALNIKLIGNFFGNIPQFVMSDKIRSLTLSHSSTDFACLRAFDIEWPSLTDFHAIDLSDRYLSKILFVAPRLRKATITHTRFLDYGSTDVLSTVCHPNLKELILKSQYPSRTRLSNLLHDVQVPELENLHIDYESEMDSAALLTFLEQTCGSLRRLHLGGVLDTSDNQKRVYELCPHLEYLSLNSFEDETIETLTSHGNSGNRPLCPELRHLNFQLLPEITRTLTSHARLDELIDSRFFKPDNRPFQDCHSLEEVALLVHRKNVKDFYFHIHDIKCTFPRFLKWRENICYLLDSRSTFYSSYYYNAAMDVLTQFGGPLDLAFSRWLPLIEDIGLFDQIENFLNNESRSREPNELVRKLHELLLPVVQDFRCTPHWQMMGETDVCYYKFVFKVRAARRDTMRTSCFLKLLSFPVWQFLPN